MAEASKVAVSTIRRVEVLEGELPVTAANAAALRNALEAAGVEFVEENGCGPGSSAAEADKAKTTIIRLKTTSERSQCPDHRPTTAALGPDFFVNPVDICGLIRDGSLILAEANRLEVNMAPAQKRLVLTRAEAACLGALRGRELLKSEIAIATKLDLVTIARELHRLAHLGLARKDQNRKWHVSARGKTCRFETAPDRPRRNGAMLGPGAKRLLDMLDGPMRQRVIAEKLEVSQQRAHHLIVKLHALGQVHFADPARPSWLVMKAGDKTPFLSRDAERVLSVLADDYATDLKKISVAVRMSAGKVKGILQELIVQSLVKAVQGLDSSPTYQITSAGLEHPQRVPDRTRAKAPRLPVESDRVRVVLSTIRDNGSLRIRDATERLRIPHQSLNALFQYLKRKQLIAKVHDDLHAPYSLTDDGRATLTEMIRRAA